jgi:UDP-N-acetylmuramate dehydrogenase
MIESNFSLKPYNTFGMDVSAKHFASFSSIAELVHLLEHPNYTNEKKLILGGGSNILFTKNFDGLVLKNNLKGIELISEDENNYFVKAQAGEVWHQFVLYCIENNYAGLENLSLIPGNVGACPIQNIGAYGVEIKDSFFELETYLTEEKKTITMRSSDCAFAYRNSIFKQELRDKAIILSVTFKLNKQVQINKSYGAIEQELQAMKIQNPTIKDISDAVCKIRSSKLPNPEITGNAGSFFKNPEIEKDVYQKLIAQFPNIVSYSLNNGNHKLAAGWLIEQCGWKGKSIGKVGVHHLQALVIINLGGANGSDVYDLSSNIIDSVYQKFGVVLEREVNIL